MSLKLGFVWVCRTSLPTLTDPTVAPSAKKNQKSCFNKDAVVWAAVKMVQTNPDFSSSQQTTLLTPIEDEDDNHTSSSSPHWDKPTHKDLLVQIDKMLHKVVQTTF